ncbi:nucleotide-binding protein [Crocosphaera chwakensis]|uniref:CD-NTase-associated protein 12/Pycsar effector protein TIR domain-containing protein n=1 Tax=Crocosphaera chwakensis CCY0110 TaxID=391612 RepID=A3IZP6_9CHRO|nr:nucleotide-binding protein [Crocosphaera chwakensis]EAZ88052.1 hypothetical protein CY0110_01005 [Crocosphaera chwakensis CCY0110]
MEKRTLEPRPAVFIGSSAENLDYAYAIQANLERDAEPTVWNQDLFKLSQSTLEDLCRQVENFDFSIFVFTPNDTVIIRKEENRSVRDNVVFELGLFIGNLGRNRCFFIIPRGEEFHLPTDLLGIKAGTYDSSRQDKNWKAALGPACREVINSIRELGKRGSSRYPNQKIDELEIKFDFLANKLHNDQKRQAKTETKVERSFDFIREWDSYRQERIKAYELFVQPHLTTSENGEILIDRQNVKPFSENDGSDRYYMNVVMEFFDRLNLAYQKELIDKDIVVEYLSKDYKLWDDEYFSIQRDIEKNPEFIYGFPASYNWLRS